MKNLRAYILLVLIVSFSINSCGPDEPLDASLLIKDTAAATGVLKVDFDGKTFEATTVQALVNDNYISISGIKTSTGEIVQITLPAPFNKVGTYTWSSVAALGGVMAIMYTPSSGVEPFLAYAKSTSGPASFLGYTDTASITISKIDVVNSKISGTFQFTGAKYSDAALTNIAIKTFTNGSFTDLTFTSDVPVTPTTNSFSAKLDGTVYTPAYIDALASSGIVNVIARRGTVETIGLSFPTTISAGTYPLDSYIGDYKAGYIKNNNADGSGIFSVNAGTMTIISHDKVNKKVIGTFTFTSNSLLVSETHNITEGAFSVSY